MKNENKNLEHSEDIFDQAVASLRQTPIPPGPSPETMEQVLTHLLTPRGNREPLSFRNLIPHFKKYAVAALIALGILAWIAWSISSTQSVAFADVCLNVRTAQTVTYKNTITLNRNGKPDPDSFVTHVMVLAPGHERTVYLTGQITIFDYQKGKGLELYPPEKKATLVNILNGSKELTNKNLLEIFRDFPENAARDLGFQPLNGRSTRLFRIARNQMVYSVWTNPKTALPVRIEYAFNQNDPLWGEPVEIKIVKSDISFNSPLNPALFALTPPKNYVVHSAAQSARPDRPDEKDVIDALRTYAQTHQGSFPPAFNLKTLLDLPPQTDWDAKKSALRAVTFVQLLRAQNQPWKYTGQNKKLHQPNTPIFQYQLKNSVRVLHADLTMTESAQ